MGIDEEDDFQEVLDPPKIVPSTKYQLSLAFPDFSQYKVQDLFSELGPVAIFSAKHHWSAPRTIKLRKDENEGYGFSVRGDAPVIIAGVDYKSLAEAAGMNEGDYVVAINEEDVKWSPHDEVVTLIKSSGNHLKLKLVTPMDKSHSKENKKSSVHNRSDHRLCNVSITSQPQSHHHLGGSSSPTSTGSSGCSSGVNIAPFSSSGVSSRESSNSSDSPTSSITSGSTRCTNPKDNSKKSSSRKDDHSKDHSHRNSHSGRSVSSSEENGNWNIFKKASTGSNPKHFATDSTSKKNIHQTHDRHSKTSNGGGRNDKNSRR